MVAELLLRMELWLLVQVMVQQPGLTWVSAHVELCFASSAAMKIAEFEHVWQLFGGPVLRGFLKFVFRVSRQIALFLCMAYVILKELLLVCSQPLRTFVFYVPLLIMFDPSNYLKFAYLTIYGLVLSVGT